MAATKKKNQLLVSSTSRPNLLFSGFDLTQSKSSKPIPRNGYGPNWFCSYALAWENIKQDINHESWSGKRFFCYLFSRASTSNVLFKLKNVIQNHWSNSMKATSDASILTQAERELSAMVLTWKRIAQEKNLSKQTREGIAKVQQGRYSTRF